MIVEEAPPTRASRARRARNPWPVIVVVMAIVGALGGRLLAQH